MFITLAKQVVGSISKCAIRVRAIWGAAITCATCLALIAFVRVSAQDHDIFLPLMINQTKNIEVQEIDEILDRDGENEIDVSDNSEANLEIREQESNSDTSVVKAASSGNCPFYRDLGSKDDRTIWWYTSLTLPSCVYDEDGGKIRILMRNFTTNNDETRIVELLIGAEAYNHDDNCRSPGPGPIPPECLNSGTGNGVGRYGWTQQSSGGQKAWILGDNQRHVLADAWGWVRIVDYRWLQAGEGPLDRDQIRIYIHPHIIAQVTFVD